MGGRRQQSNRRQPNQQRSPNGHRPQSQLRQQDQRALARLHKEIGRSFGLQLRGLRERAGMSQAELASERCDRSFIAKLESGASLPSLETLTVLAAALGVGRHALIPRNL